MSAQNKGFSKDLSRDHVVTLLANPGVLPLSSLEVDSVVDAIQNHGGFITGVEWLAENEACDIFFAVLPLEEAREMIGHLIANVSFDAIVQKASGRKKKLLISDMDSTIINQECIDELADFAGLKAKVSAITERAMNGEIDFESALKERVALLKGLPESVLQKVYDERITLMPGAKTLVATMKKQGAACILVSGGFTFFTSRIRDAVGFDLDESNLLDVEHGVLKGTVKLPILGKQAKRDALSFYTEKYGLAPDETLAVGDGANDVPMLELAGLGVAYRAKPAVQKQVSAQINTCDLTALLYIQGFKKDQVCFT